MTGPGLTPELLGLLRQVDTPTVCNAIEVVQGRRGFDGFTRGTMVSTDTTAPAVVGFAHTAAIQGAAPPAEPPENIRARRLDYFRHMANGPGPAVAVIEDRDHPDCVGAWWGEVHVAVHRGLGLAGAVTNGLVRDLDDLAPGFPVIAGGIGVSHAFVHVVEYGREVNVLGLSVNEGDLLHADRHGAVVIPADVWTRLESAIKTLHECEALILGPAGEDGFGLEALLDAWSKFERART